MLCLFDAKFFAELSVFVIGGENSEQNCFTHDLNPAKCEELPVCCAQNVQGYFFCDDNLIFTKWHLSMTCAWYAILHAVFNDLLGYVMKNTAIFKTDN